MEEKISICKAPDCGNLVFGRAVFCCSSCAKSGLLATFSKWEAAGAAAGVHDSATVEGDKLRAYAAEIAGRVGVNPVPCAKPPQQLDFVPGMLSGSQRKTAFALRQNVEAMIAGNSSRRLVEFTKKDGTKGAAWLADRAENLDRIGFLTLTVGDYDADGKFRQVWDAKEASRRINNLNRRVLPELFERAVLVTERHKSGAIHFHVVGLLRSGADIRTGFDFEALAQFQKSRRKFAAADVGACLELAGLWKMLRKTLPEYGFGRSELTPIRSTGEAVACYVSKYIEKNVCCRRADDARKKLVRYLGFWHFPTGEEIREYFQRTGKIPKRISEQTKPNDFSWGTKRAIAWRCKAREMGALVDIYEREDMAVFLGARWAHTVTKLWQRVCGDDLSPFLVADFNQKELLRVELAREMGFEVAAKLDRKKLTCADSARDFAASYAAGICVGKPILPADGVEVRKIPLPCAFPRRVKAWKIGENPVFGAFITQTAKN